MRSLATWLIGLVVIGTVLTRGPAWNSVDAVAASVQQIRVAPLPVLGALPLFTALESGVFERHGLKVALSENPGSNDTAQSLMHDQVDIVYTGIAFALTSSEKFNLHVKYLTTGSLQGEFAGKKADYEQILVRRDIEIKSPSDFQGKTVCVQTLDGGLTHSLSMYLLKKNGVNPETVKWKAVPFPQMLAALASGQCDVAVSSQPFTAQIQQRNLGYAVDHILGRPTMVVAALGNPALATMWWTTQERFARSPEPFQRFVVAMMEAVKYAYAHPDEAIKATAKHTGGSVDSLRSFAFTSVIFHPFSTDSQEVRPMLERWVHVLKDVGFIKADVDVGGFF